MARDVSKDAKQTIGEILKHLRQEKLWSQAELASRIGTTPVSVGRWENNVTRPNLHFQQQLCEIFARSPEELGFLSQPELESRESSEGNDQQQGTEPGPREQTTIHSSFPMLVPVHSTPLQSIPVPRKTVLRQQGRFLVVMTCLSLCLLLGSILLYRQNTLSSTSHPPSCQAPSSHESATVIYTQVMCKHAQISSALDRQDGMRWDENEQCHFQQGAYHVLLPASEYVAECFAHTTTPFGPNFALQADITILKGYSGGLVFRAEGPSSNWDVIISRVPIDIWGQYNFDLASTNVPCHLTKDPIAPTYCYSPHGTITYGVGATNTMTLIALGSQVYLYVNGFFIDQARAPASSPLTGFLGVFANGSKTTADVAFRHLQIWNI